jgi:FtsP/CotA-like multicopper oxidase with cupredoxin domain
MVQAFGESERRPTIPGPLVRVREGTVIEATVRNAIPGAALVVHGLARRPAVPSDTLHVGPGAARTTRFVAGVPGTYFYWATTTDRPPDDREGLDSQLSGAFVVDPPEGPVRADRIFVMGAWSEPVDTLSTPQVWREALVINGKSWPHTERLALDQGDTVDWRWVNATDRPHPMHLHGFYYEVLSLGDADRDTLLRADARPFVVTHHMRPWSTMAMRYVPHTPGNWVFHCHILYHIETAGLEPLATADRHALAASHGMDDMRGLVLAMHVRPRGTLPPNRGAPRRLRLFAQARPRHFGDSTGYGFVLQDGAEPAPDSVRIPGSAIVLRRDELTYVTVVNRLPEPTAVHWHGLELQSLYDGVAGMSGMGRRLAPSIAPGDSFTAVMAPPRAGTFIYHTHLNDVAQATRGLYGPLIVLEPGERHDIATDLVWLHSVAPDGAVLFNGRSGGHEPIVLRAGAPHRIRMIGFPPAGRLRFAIMQGDRPATWRALAKDGADLPPALQLDGPASQLVSVGETYDVRFVPRAGDDLRMELHVGNDVRITVPIMVR